MPSDNQVQGQADDTSISVAGSDGASTVAADAIQHRLPTPFQWVEPALIPPRPWLYGRHLLRKQVSVTFAPGGVGKSSNSIVEALAMASGKPIAGEWVQGPLRS